MRWRDGSSLIWNIPIPCVTGPWIPRMWHGYAQSITDHDDLWITVPEWSKRVSRMDTQGSRLGTPKSIILGPIFGWVPCQKHGSKTEQGAKTVNGNGKVLCTFDFTKTCFSHVMFWPVLVPQKGGPKRWQKQWFRGYPSRIRPGPHGSHVRKPLGVMSDHVKYDIMVHHLAPCQVISTCGIPGIHGFPVVTHTKILGSQSLLGPWDLVIWGQPLVMLVLSPIPGIADQWFPLLVSPSRSSRRSRSWILGSWDRQITRDHGKSMVCGVWPDWPSCGIP